MNFNIIPRGLMSLIGRQSNTSQPGDFKYKNDMTNIPKTTIDALTELENAINKKRAIFKQYSGLLVLLKALDDSLGNYIKERSEINTELEYLKQRQQDINAELANENQQVPQDTVQIERLEDDLGATESQISRLTEDNTLIVKKIEDLIEEAATYINQMDPKDNEALRKIKQNLEEKLKTINPGINLEDIYTNAAPEEVAVTVNPNAQRIEETGTVGGYRYNSSSRLKRKLRSNSKKMNSSSSSSSSQRKIRKSKKNKLTGGKGGKRTKRTTSKRGSNRRVKSKH